MGRFNQIKQLQSKVKNQIIESILSNQTLLKYLCYDDSSPETMSDIENTISVLNDRLFTTPKIITTTTDTKSFIVIHFTNYTISRNGGSFKNSQIIFDVITHESLVENLNNGYNRLFCIIDEIDTLFNGSHGYWVGTMEFDSCRELIVSDSFSGYRLTYNVTYIN